VADDLFPSGPWVGFYNYGPGDRHRMDLHLDFSGGSVTGDGNDDVGRFLIRGRFDSANCECHWTKTYPGSRDVYYRGFREGKGIWGTWEIGIFAHGGFHIWPKGERDGQTTTAAAEASAPAEAIGENVKVGAPAIAVQGWI
jgi:hypothetical protein